MSDGGKGCVPRPFGVPKEVYESNWDAIFKKDKVKDNTDDLQTVLPTEDNLEKK